MFDINREKGMVSVLILTYKQKDYLFQTIDSVLIQDYPQIELIVADDCSPEFDCELIKKYIVDNNRGNISSFTVFTNEVNLGTVKNENKALCLSKGEFIKIIAGDDTFKGEKLFSEQVEVLRKNPDKWICVGKAQQCDSNMNPILDPIVEKSNESISEIVKLRGIEPRKYVFKNRVFPIAIQASCFNASYFIQNGLCDERYSVIDDAPTMLNLLDNTSKIIVFDKKCVNHRAGVGVSSSKEFLAVRQLKYYYDDYLLNKYEIMPYRKDLGVFKCLARYRRSKFFYKYISAKKDKCFWRKFLTIITHIDVIITYAMLYPKRLIHKMRGMA